MQIIQRYSAAVVSSNLRDDEHHHHAEVLGAAGLAARTNSLGVKLFRVKYASDASSYHSLLAEWEKIISKKSSTANWPEEISRPEIAKISLDYWLADVCPRCAGKGREFVKDVPTVMSDEPCHSCHGTAKRSIDARKYVKNYVAEMVESLEKMALNAGSETSLKHGK